MSIHTKEKLSNQKVAQAACPVLKTAEIIGRQWKIVILWQLMTGAKRFNELKRLLSGVTQKMLTQELRQLEEDGVIARKVFPQIPPKVEYSLTKKGDALRKTLESMAEWGSKF
jgi:DNA-binding HxlR family transcriptional regulator